MQHRRERALGALLALGFACFALSVASAVVRDTLCCADDAQFAVVAKNVARGDGYQTVGLTGLGGIIDPAPPDTRLAEYPRFDWSITTGPALLYPVALAIRGLGNTYWVPGAATALITFALLLAVHLRGRRLAQDRTEWLASGVVFLVLCNLATVPIYPHWAAMFGEFPTALWVVLGLAVLAEDPRGAFHTLVAGLLLGVGIQTKLVALFALVGAAAWLLVAGDTRRALSSITRLVCGAAAPLLVWKLHQLAVLGPAEFLRFQNAELGFIASYGSGVRELDAAPDPLPALWATARRNLAVLAGEFGGALAAGAFGVAIGIAARSVISRKRPVDRFAQLLLSATAVHACWWIFLGAAGRARHLRPALIYSLAALALALAGSRRATRAALVVALLFAFAHLAPRAAEILPRERPFEPSERVRNMLALANHLERGDPKDVLAAGWWASVADLEYLLDGQARFVRIRNLTPDDVPGARIALNELWYAGKWSMMRRRLEEVVHRCGARLEFAAWPYFLYRCPRDKSDEKQLCRIGGASVGCRVAAEPCAARDACSLPHDEDYCFDEEWYLRAHPGVAAAVRKGEYGTGFQHWMLAGRKMGWRPFDPSAPPPGCARAATGG